MKFTKMSLVAALLIGSSAFAIDNVKVSGDAKLFYSTTDDGSANSDLFGKSSSMGESALSLGLTADLTKNISAGTKGTVISTLGLYNNLVSSTWTGGTEDTYVVNEAWLAGTFGKTTLKVGRMALDTPLVFTETWSIVENTFEAAVVINQDIPDTTLVGAYVGQADGTVIGSGISQANSPFTSFYNGAYAAGVVNNSFKPLTAQAWYFNLRNIADAYWLQADLDGSSLGVNGLMAGAQYSAVKLSNNSVKTSDVYALMLGYEMKDVATAKVSYSSVNEGGDFGGAGFNTATTQATAQSKLYTETWWTYGRVTQSGTDSWNVTVESPVNGLVDLGVYYTYADQSNAVGNIDMSEITVTAGKDFGPLNATVAYISTDITAAKRADTLQAYLTLNF